MIEKLKKSQFASALGVQNAYVKVNVNRGKIFEDSEGFINLKHPTNKIFIDNHLSNGKTFDINLIYTKSQPKNIVRSVPVVKDEYTEQKKEKPRKTTDSEKEERASLIEEKTKLEIEKLRVTIEMDQLKKSKIEGTLIPVDAIQHVFMWAIDTFHKSYVQEVDALANVFKQVYGADHNKYIRIIKELTQALNKIKTDAKDNLINGVDGVINEYQEVRGRGERK